MVYCISRDISLQKSVRKVALDQIDKSIEEVISDKLNRHKIVHQVRKRCKKLRGLIRLVRPQFSDYRRENEFFRDAARQLSYVRDAQSSIDCFGKLAEHFQCQVDWDAFAPIRELLAQRRQTIADDRVGLQRKLDEFLTKMREARKRAAQWKIKGSGFSGVQGGLTRTYQRGRKALRSPYEDPSTENFHEWRKRVKDHWYHARLLRCIWPDLMKVWRDASERLSDLLGNDHDLAVFRQTLLDAPDRFGSELDLKTLVGLIDLRRAELQANAQPLGQRLFAEKPKQLCARMAIYWDTWKSTADTGLPSDLKVPACGQ